MKPAESGKVEAVLTGQAPSLRRDAIENRRRAPVHGDRAGRHSPRSGSVSRVGLTHPAGDLVAYCGSGITACVILHRLHLAGRTDARLYPGAWSEWEQHAALPREQG